MYLSDFSKKRKEKLYYRYNLQRQLQATMTEVWDSFAIQSITVAPVHICSQRVTEDLSVEGILF